MQYAVIQFPVLYREEYTEIIAGGMYSVQNFYDSMQCIISEGTDGQLLNNKLIDSTLNYPLTEQICFFFSQIHLDLLILAIYR